MRNWYCFLAALLFSSTVYSQKPGDAEIQKAKEGYGKGDLQGWLNEAEKAAKLGHVDGYAFMALAYDPVFASTITYPETKDASKALLNYKKAAELGHPESAYTAGEMYRLGEGTEKNTNEALAYYKKAYALNHDKAPNTLYQLMGKDAYVKFLQESIEGGNFNAARELGTMYIIGETVEKDIDQAMKWLQVGEKHNHGGCYYVIGYLYRNGMDAGQDGKISLGKEMANPEKAAEYFTKGAQVGDVECMYGLAEMYYQGLELKQYMPKAFSYFKMACEENVGVCCHMCSVMITNKQAEGSAAEAQAYAKRALELGYKP